MQAKELHRAGSCPLRGRATYPRPMRCAEPAEFTCSAWALESVRSPVDSAVKLDLEGVDPVNVRGHRHNGYDPTAEPTGGSGVGSVVADDHRWSSPVGSGATTGSRLTRYISPRIIRSQTVARCHVPVCGVLGTVPGPERVKWGLARHLSVAVPPYGRRRTATVSPERERRHRRNSTSSSGRLTLSFIPLCYRR